MSSTKLYTRYGTFTIESRKPFIVTATGSRITKNKDSNMTMKVVVEIKDQKFFDGFDSPEDWQLSRWSIEYNSVFGVIWGTSDGEYPKYTKDQFGFPETSFFRDMIESVYIKMLDFRSDYWREFNAIVADTIDQKIAELEKYEHLLNRYRVKASRLRAGLNE